MASRKIVLVTGGNNGIGYEIVKALLESEKPYHVLLGSRSLSKAKAAVENLKSEVPDTSNTVEILQVDLTSDESIEKAFEQVKSGHGYLDVLINNAGKPPFPNLCPVTTCGSIKLSDELTYSRSILRPSLPSRQSVAQGMLQQRLRRKRGGHPRANPHFHPPPSRLQISLPIPFHTQFSTPHIRSRPLPNHRRSKELLPDAAAAGRLAEENRVRDDRVP